MRTDDHLLETHKRPQSLVERLGKEWRKGGHHDAERVEDGEEHIQRDGHLVQPIFVPEPAPIEANVPVGQRLDESEQGRQDSVQPVHGHLLAHQRRSDQ